MSKDKLVLINLLLAILLAGCQDVSVEGATETSIMSTPTSVEVQVTPSTPPTSIPTAMPTISPSPTVAVTSTPFLCPYLHGNVEIGTWVSEAMGEEVQFLIHLPPCYDQHPSRAFPVVYLLHGWPLDEHHWDSLGIDELADDWISRGLVGPFIIVMPGVSDDGLYVNSSGGSQSFEGMLVDELVPLIDRTYRTWRAPEGRAIGGISRGGVWALEIALRHQDLFGIVGAHSPALALNRPMPQYDPFLLVKKDVTGLRFYLDAGNKDWARASTSRLRDALLEAEAEVTYKIHEGGHVDALWRSALTDYLDFYTATWPLTFGTLPPWGHEVAP